MPPPPESNVLQATALLGSIKTVHPSPLEQEVVDLFDQLRNRLLRYLFGFGLSAPDCEEILQETFLALFQHLQRGKSRESLRAWLFRVAHNLALETAALPPGLCEPYRIDDRGQGDGRRPRAQSRGSAVHDADTAAHEGSGGGLT